MSVSAAHKVCGAVESTKASSEVFAPISGVVATVNSKVVESPELVNKSPESDGALTLSRALALAVVRRLCRARSLFLSRCDTLSLWRASCVARSLLVARALVVGCDSRALAPGWLFTVKPSKPEEISALMDKKQYDAFCAAGGH